MSRVGWSYRQRLHGKDLDCRWCVSSSTEAGQHLCILRRAFVTLCGSFAPPPSCSYMRRNRTQLQAPGWRICGALD